MTHIMISSDNRKVEIIQNLGHGTLSSRYRVRIDGQDYFLKTDHHSQNCSGTTSRNTIKNELSIHELVRTNREANQKNSRAGRNALEDGLYLGHIEIGDKLGILFKYLDQTGLNLADVFDVKDDFNGESLTPEEKQVKVEARAHPYSLEEIVHLTIQAAEQAQEYHEVKFWRETDGEDGEKKKIEKEGVIHMDISPRNILLYTQSTKTAQGTTRQKKAKLVDLGIAREKGASATKLFNQTTPGKVSGNYYSSPDSYLQNDIYHPPNVEKDYCNAEPSYDSYNLTNVLCLMLTGRLIEYWKHKEKDGNKEKYWIDRQILCNTKERAQIKTPLSPKEKEETIYQNLTQIILTGTHDEKAKRYQSAKDLAEGLRKLNLPEPRSLVPELSFPETTIPDYLSNGEMEGLDEKSSEYGQKIAEIGSEGEIMVNQKREIPSFPGEMLSSYRKNLESLAERREKFAGDAKDYEQRLASAHKRIETILAQKENTFQEYNSPSLISLEANESIKLEQKRIRDKKDFWRRVGNWALGIGGALLLGATGGIIYKIHQDSHDQVQEEKKSPQKEINSERKNENEPTKQRNTYQNQTKDRVQSKVNPPELATAEKKVIPETERKLFPEPKQGEQRRENLADKLLAAFELFRQIPKVPAPLTQSVASSPANKPPEVSFDNCPSEIVPEVFSAMQNSENHFIYSCRLKVKDDSPSVKCGITCQGKYSLLKVDNFPYSAKLKLGEYCGPCPVTGDNVEIKARCTDTGELSGRDLAKIPLKKMDLLSIEPPPAPKTSACGSRYTIPEFEKPENWSEYHCATSGCSCEDIIKKEKKLVKKGCYYLKEYSTSAFRKEHNQIDCYLCCPPGVE